MSRIDTVLTVVITLLSVTILGVAVVFGTLI